MQTYLKTKPVWVQLLLFLGMAFGMLMVVFLLGGMLLGKITGISLLQMGETASWDFDNPGTLVMVRGMMLLQFLGLFLIPSLLFAYFSDPYPKDYIGLKNPVKPGFWIIGILAMMLAIPIVEYLGLINRGLPFGTGTRLLIEKMEAEAARTLQFLLGQHTTKDLFINLIFIALFAGVGEELFFRGIIQRLLIRGTGNVWLGIIVTALVFSFFHFQFFGFLPRFFLGLLLGAVYWYSGSLWTAILAHFLYDAVIIVVLHFHPQYAESTTGFLNEAQLPWLALGSAVLVAACVWWMKKKSGISYDAVYAAEHDETARPHNSSY
jgi:membrane protease YdiL (CAAX protease family)